MFFVLKNRDDDYLDDNGERVHRLQDAQMYKLTIDAGGLSCDPSLRDGVLARGRANDLLMVPVDLRVRGT